MAQPEIRQLLATLKLTAFYEQAGHYQVDDNVSKINQQQVQTILDRIMHQIESRRRGNDDDEANRYAATVVALRDQIDAYFTYLKTVKISSQVFEKYLETHQVTDLIKAYQDQHQLVVNAATVVYYFEDQIDFENAFTRVYNNEDEETKPPKPQIKILNHHNPFADVHIKNQAFLYQNTEQQFDTLRFQLGYQMTTVENVDQKVLAIKPNFKISQSSERNVDDQPIAFDDTLTEKMPETNQATALFYI